jgi:hypothetical protein
VLRAEIAQRPDSVEVEGASQDGGVAERRHHRQVEGWW